MAFFYFFVAVYAAFIFWLGSKILHKAGFDRKWVFCLLIPIVNVFMIWAFAFSNWPNLKADVKQGIN